MNVTLTLEDRLVKEVRKIAAEKETTLSGLVRGYLERVVSEHASSGRKKREREALERTFEQFQFRVGKRTWTREDLHDRR